MTRDQQIREAVALLGGQGRKEVEVDVEMAISNIEEASRDAEEEDQWWSKKNV